MDLRSQLTGVPQDSLPVEPEPEEKPSKKESKGEDRSLDNVRGELLRKQEKFQTDIMSVVDDLKTEIRGLIDTRSESKKPAAQTSSDPLAEYSTAQLEAMRPQIPEENRAQFESYLTDRKVSEKIESKLGNFTKTLESQQKREQYSKQALDRYPDLGDTTSEFARKVERELQRMPSIDKNPRALLDAANEVAAIEGVKPAMRRKVQGKPAPTGTAPADSPEPETRLSDEERASIAKKLRAALPKGKTFNMDRIKKREQFYGGDELALRINK